MILFPHTALLALVLSLLGYGPPFPPSPTRQPTCPDFAHTAAFFDTCAVYNTSAAAPFFGSVEHLDAQAAFAILRAAAPPAPPLPTFSELPFLPPLASSTASSSSARPSQYHLLLLHTSTDPFSLHALPHFHIAARRFPTIRFLAVDCEAENVYTFHRLINTTVTLPFPFISASSTAPTNNATWLLGPSFVSSLWPRLRSLLSLSSWWVAGPALPPPPAAAPSLSFSSHYLVRGLPSLLLFHQSVVQQPSIRWPRSLAQLTQHIAHVTGEKWEMELDDEEGEVEMDTAAGMDESEVENVDDDVSELDELFGVTSELDYGLLFGVLGMSVVHWLHRLKDRMDRWEVEAMAVQHVAM